MVSSTLIKNQEPKGKTNFMNQVYCERIEELCFASLLSGDETETELARDLITAAIGYAKYRMDYAIKDNAWKIDNDKYRTSAHNYYMDCLNIFLRYIRKQGKEVPDLTDYDRKELGDIACYLAYKSALGQR